MITAHIYVASRIQLQSNQVLGLIPLLPSCVTVLQTFLDSCKTSENWRMVQLLSCIQGSGIIYLFYHQYSVISLKKSFNVHESSLAGTSEMLRKQMGLTPAHMSVVPLCLHAVINQTLSVTRRIQVLVKMMNKQPLFNATSVLKGPKLGGGDRTRPKPNKKTQTKP